MDIKASTNFSITGAFYAKDANGGEGILTTPTTGKCEVVDAAGAKIAGSPFALAAVAGSHAGIVTTGALNIAATGYYSYTFYDQADPTPTIAHVSGFFHIVSNDNDDLDGEIDTLTTNLATANTALTDIKGASFNSATDSLKILSDGIDTTIAQTTAAAIAAAVWNALTASYATVSTFGKAVADILGFGAAPSANTTRDAVWNATRSSYTTAGTTGQALTDLLTTSGPGAGSIHVTINTGGANNLKPVDSGTLAALTGVLVQAYLTSDWDAGNRSATYLKGQTVTDANGAFTWDLMLAAGAYTLSYTVANYQGTTKTVTVS